MAPRSLSALLLLALALVVATCVQGQCSKDYAGCTGTFVDGGNGVRAFKFTLFWLQLSCLPGNVVTFVDSVGVRALFRFVLPSSILFWLQFAFCNCRAFHFWSGCNCGCTGTFVIAALECAPCSLCSAF